jgi:RNA polymerase sigma-70 factor (ECF subfamily)
MLVTVAPLNLLDAESQRWLDRLDPRSGERDAAVAELHALLLKAARFEVRRRGASLAPSECEDVAQQSADDALVAVLRRLPDFRGDSRFTTWVYKFALLEAGVKARRRAWKGREVQLEPERWALIERTGATPHEQLETAELLSELQDAVARDLTPHQRRVLLAVALHGVPIDVLAERLDTTRGALYKTIHDARRKLRAVLAAWEIS